MNKPFQTYNGGKEADGTFQKIISLMPPHDIYIEPFIGNGAVFRHKLPARIHNFLVDIDPAVANAWSAIVDGSCTVINSDAFQFIKFISLLQPLFSSLSLKVLIYFDPPYPFITRKSSKSLYAYELSDQDHIKLLTYARNCPFPCIISSYYSDLYSKHLFDWNHIQFQSATRSGAASEFLWYNYPTPSILHDYRYIGSDFRDRARIKGIILRQISKFKRMPAVELNYLLSQLMSAGIIK